MPTKVRPAGSLINGKNNYLIFLFFPPRWEGLRVQFIFVITERAGLVPSRALQTIMVNPEILNHLKAKIGDKTGKNIYGRPMVTQVQNGTFVNIWPERIANNNKAIILDRWKQK